MLRRWAMRLLLAFAAFYIVTRPTQAAETASALVEILHHAADAVSALVTRLNR